MTKSDSIEALRTAAREYADRRNAVRQLVRRLPNGVPLPPRRMFGERRQIKAGA